MGNVLAFLHSVDNEVVKIMKFFEFLFGDVIHVSAVGNVPEAVAQYWQFVMHSTYRDDVHRLFKLVFRNLFMDMLVSLPAQPNNPVE